MRIYFLLFSFCLSTGLVAQTDQEDWNFYQHLLFEQRQQTDADFRDPEKSPLDKDKLAGFSGLEYFPIDSNYKVSARFIRHKKREKFRMPTSTDRMPQYRRHGMLIFELQGVACTLQVFQNVELVKKEAYRNHLFLPFTDLSSGDESYGGGRYLDIEVDRRLKEGRIILDFNLAYNPYCAYGSRWSCPIPPRENDLKVKVAAGVKDYGEH